ncbi:MAG: riboflavin biosynthesis protein RibF [Muribaculaceae bacterium]|nr:riboflavin biosynthesis protein RibF [Muribaculaceae bacterium]
MNHAEQNTAGRVATVGTFDGVHRGHRAVLQTVKRIADAEGLRPAVITFDRHPLEVVAPERAPKRLMTPADEAATLASLGLEVEVIPFTRELMGLSAGEWMERMARDMGVRTLVVGYDNTFGRDGIDMSVADYICLGRLHGIEVVKAPIVPAISSSAIRRAVGEGRVEKAAGMLGRPYSLEGTVEQGNRLGRTIGFPTANLRPEAGRLVPANGVYSADAILPGGERRRAVVNIGVRPTVGDNLRPTVEAHIIGWHGDLYGKELTLEFLRHLRDERRFDSLDSLKRQIEADTAEASR